MDPDAVVGALGRVVFAQTLAQTVSLYANDGVVLLIELRRPAQGFDGDIVLLDLPRRTLEVLLTDVGEHICEIGSTIEDAGGQHRMKLRSFQFEIAGRLHSNV